MSILVFAAGPFGQLRKYRRQHIWPCMWFIAMAVMYWGLRSTDAQQHWTLLIATGRTALGHRCAMLSCCWLSLSTQSFPLLLCSCRYETCGSR